MKSYSVNLFERFGARENPFGPTPNPRYLFQSRSHAEARASLIVGLESGLGFQALIAPPGMGKTTILFDLLERFSSSARTAFLFQIQGGTRDFLRSLLYELNIEMPGSDLLKAHESINRLLTKECRAGKKTIVIIDEAQSLSPSVLEAVRLLSNFETPTHKLLQIVLAGQPELAQRLAFPNLAQLQQRISIVKTLAPFGLEETKGYVAHRLKVAGFQSPTVFTPGAIRLLWEKSHGVPREINTICFNALLLAAGSATDQVDESMVREVIADLDPIFYAEHSVRNTKPPFFHQQAPKPGDRPGVVSAKEEAVSASEVVEAARILVDLQHRLQSCRSQTRTSKSRFP